MSRPVIRVLLGASLPCLVLVVWWWVSGTPGTLLPTPVEVGRLLLHPLQTPQTLDAPSLAQCSLVSVIRLLLGFVWAGMIAVPLGLWLGRSRGLRALLAPGMTALRMISPLAWLPLLIVLIGLNSLAELWYGPRDAWRHSLLDQIKPAMVLIIGWAAFFPILLTCEHAARTVRRHLLEAVRVMGASGLTVVRRVIVPHCLPEILNGLRIGLGRAWMVIVAAEMYPGTRSGLGYMIWTSHNEAHYAYTVAAVILIGGIGLLGNGLLYLVQIRVGHWQARH